MNASDPACAHVAGGVRATGRASAVAAIHASVRHVICRFGAYKPWRTNELGRPRRQCLRDGSDVCSVQRIREHRGLREALAYLAEITQFRFVAVVRFEAGRLDAVGYHDRQDRELVWPARWPAAVKASCYIRDGAGALTTVGAAELLAHATEEDETRACRSVPVLDPEGRVRATLCLYDNVVHDPAGVDLSLLLQVAADLARSDAAQCAAQTGAAWGSAARKSLPQRPVV